MLCRYCQKNISIAHRLVDKDFCCKQHRNAFSARSARVLREMGEFTYSAADVLRETDEFAVPKKPQTNGARSTATVLGLAALTIAGLVVMEKLGVGAGAAVPAAKGSDQPSSVGRLVGMVMDRIPKSSPGVAIEDRFQTGLRSWLPAPGSALSGWRTENGLIRPGGLRIWDESRNLADYSFQFEGRVENRALGWVVRAPNHNNYYAAKLALPELGSSPRPEIIRFSVIQGQESRRQHLPVPVQLEKGEFYDFEVRAIGDRIVTLVGGRVIDQWRDARFRTGGVGFFNERGDRSSIRWARLREDESIADKLRSYLTFGLALPRF